ncbi:MAG: signal peptidase I [Bdellovibrionaceae bacterium]|nr:signal peptidase I [Pseudobdellovibrionaceae bacterium]
MFKVGLGFLFACVFALVFDQFIIESILVPTPSMSPTILPNERIYVQKWPKPNLKRFDIVVIQLEYPKKKIIKRIIGLPGECIQLKNSYEVYIDGKKRLYSSKTGKNLKEDDHEISLEPHPIYRFPTVFGKETFCLSENEYYVLGDKRKASLDSRFFGSIYRDQILGIARLTWYSYDKKNKKFRWDQIGFLN